MLLALQTNMRLGEEFAARAYTAAEPPNGAMGTANIYRSPHHDSGFYPFSYDMPETGVIGTLAHLLAGAFMMLVSSVLGVSKRRMR